MLSRQLLFALPLSTSDDHSTGSVEDSRTSISSTSRDRILVPSMLPRPNLATIGEFAVRTSADGHVGASPEWTLSDTRSVRPTDWPSSETTGSRWKKSFAFFCRDNPDDIHRANSAKNGTGSKRLNVADVNSPLHIALINLLISAVRLRDLTMATKSVISRIHAALQ